MIQILALTALALAQQRDAPNCCGMEAFLTDSKFVAIHGKPVARKFQAQVGKKVTYRDTAGHETKGFYVPPKTGAKAALVMIHEWWGLNQNIEAEAERIHGLTGYAVLAVDLYEGKVATTPEDAGRFMREVNADRAKAIVKAAVGALKKGDFGFRAAKIGTVGFCFGGGWSFQTAVQGGPQVNACAIFYGMPDNSAIPTISAPVIFIHPKRDQWITDSVVSTFVAEMRKNGKAVEAYHYDADHAFANPSQQAYNKQAAAAAWAKTLAFFKRNLS